MDSKSRIINLNNSESESNKTYQNNEIQTSKYNLLTFLPYSIFLQFNNYFNIYFLISTIIFSLPQISNYTPFASIFPFALVISIGVIREGFEDYKKASFDKLYNNSKCTVIENNIEREIRWKDVHVGDILRIKKNETIPADILVLKSEIKNGYCYLETMNLDGESALKVKEAVGYTHLKISNYNDLSAVLNVDLPNKEIYNFNASMTYFEEKNIEQKIFFDNSNLLLRSGKLKNTEWVDGLVVYTGKDTKIMQNINNYSQKISYIDSIMNKLIIYLIVIMLSICTSRTIRVQTN